MANDYFEDDEADEVLTIFVTESREHLASIENDLLAIEDMGEAIDEALVNKVFRAAHSIKGGSGFFGFTNIKELAHKAETILDMLRTKKMKPNAEVTNLLLAAFDQLRVMINNPNQSDTMDVSTLIESLVVMASSYLPEDKKASVSSNVTLANAKGTEAVVIPHFDIDRVKGAGMYVCLVNCDLIHDIDQKGLNILTVFSQFPPDVEVLDCTVDYGAVGTLDDPVVNHVPVKIVLASKQDPQAIPGFLAGLAPDAIQLLAVPEPTPAQLPSMELVSPMEVSLPQDLEAVQEAPKQVKATLESINKPVVSPSPMALGDAGAVEDTIRVHVSLLENLMNLAGELVLSRNQLRAAVASDDRKLLASANQRVNQVTTELQEVIMQTRLQPVGSVFAKFPRLVRDLSQSLGKDIQLIMEGREVALDKTLVEGLSDPLTHMIRNAIDHGVELPEIRVRAGKKPQGTVRIEARHEAGQVIVEISDDGGGIDAEKVAASALKKGLISADRIRGLTEKDKQALIFLPGLSTASTVSDVSGRGVGMDVVKTNLDRLGGQVEIISALGRGSTFRIKLPLTLVIMPSLIITVAGERFAIPQANIDELLRLRPQDVKTRIEIVGDSEVLRLRDKILPLSRCVDILGGDAVYLDPSTGKPGKDRRHRIADRRSPKYALGELGMVALNAEQQDSHRGERGFDERRSVENSTIKIVVVNTGTMSYGLVVDEFHTTEEVVVKPLGRRFKHMAQYSGATILGDGAIALILDVGGMATKAGLGMVTGSVRAAELAAAADAQRFQDIQSMLLFHNGPREQCAIPLDLVLRIERIQGRQIERLGQLRTIQYRGRSLPLISLADVAKVDAVEEEESMVVLVAMAHGREFGILGTGPIDALEAKLEIDQTTHRQLGIAGSAIIEGRTTLVIDMFELVDTAHPEWSKGAQAKVIRGIAQVDKLEEAKGPPTILLAEDSTFFRTQLKKYLEDAGYIVLAGEDGLAAWELLQANYTSVSVVVTDIEMPRMNGLEFAAKIKGDPRTRHLPIIAVTSLAGEDDAARGMAAGINEYQVKLDRDRLIQSIQNYSKSLATV